MYWLRCRHELASRDKRHEAIFVAVIARSNFVHIHIQIGFVMFIANPHRKRSQYTYRTVADDVSEFCVHSYAIVEATNAARSRAT